MPSPVSAEMAMTFRSTGAGGSAPPSRSTLVEHDDAALRLDSQRRQHFLAHRELVGPIRVRRVHQVHDDWASAASASVARNDATR